MRLGTVYRTKLFGRLGVRPAGTRVLDVGTHDSYWLSKQVGDVRVGIDLDIRHNVDVMAVRGDGLRLPFADATFDSVFAFDVIEHVDDAEALVRELVRVAAPGGEITMSTPNADLRIFPAILTSWAHRRWGHYDKTGYSPDEMIRLFKSSGVAHVEATPLRTWTFLTFYLPLSVGSRLSRRLNDALCGLAAAIDSHFKTGQRGYVLTRARR
jgi:SAM-dependent methyltransferase